jgi:hypothetical protein
MNSGSQTITLKHPITVAGATIETLTLRRPKAGDFRRMDKISGGDLDKILFLVSALASLSPAEVDDLDGEDLTAVSEVITGFTKQQA